jgi:DNA-binding CsgD family transcriptional regulator/tetratricopeptide (TPR) repeat protein
VAEQSDSQRTRYRMLDTIREYAHEKLDADAESEVRRRHARYFVGWCAQAGNEVRYRHQMEWLSQLDDEQGNIRLALEWCLAEAPADAMRLVFGMYRYWALRGHLAEGLDWCERALAVQVDDVTALASAHIARANMLWHMGDYTRARQDAERCEELIAAEGGSQLLYGAIVVQGILAAGRLDWTESMRLHEKAFQVAWQLKDPWWIGSSLNNLALIAMERGDHDIARGRLEQALASFMQTGDRLSTSMTQDSLARANLRLGDYASSRRNWMEAIPVSSQFGVVNLTNMLEGLAHLEIAEGRVERAVTLISAAQALRKPIGLELAPEWKIEVDQTLERARGQLTRPAADAAWKLGSAFNLGDAVRFATGTAPMPAPSTGTNGDGDHMLTARERQVALLIAEGLTNPEIAARLRMAERTADAHVEHIRNKLGLRSRSQIAVWAHERLGTS